MPAADAFDPDVPVFRRLAAAAEGRAWLHALPKLIERLELQWAIDTGHPYLGGSSSWAAPATTAKGTPAVLKVAWPHREARGESIGLRLWDGNGAPRLYAAEPSAYAVLMERCDPGLVLSEATMSPEESLVAAATVLRTLWISPPADHGLERLGDVCEEWSAVVRARQAALHPPFDQALVELGASLLESLPTSTTKDVVVHGDANPTNFLTATRAPWLLIDAKPMVGDPAYDVAPLVLQLGSPMDATDPERVMRERFAVLGEHLGQPIERMVAWCVARAVESALWYASMDEIELGSEEMATVATLARLLDS